MRIEAYEGVYDASSAVRNQAFQMLHDYHEARVRVDAFHAKMAARQAEKVAEATPQFAWSVERQSAYNSLWREFYQVSYGADIRAFCLRQIRGMEAEGGVR